MSHLDTDTIRTNGAARTTVRESLGPVAPRIARAQRAFVTRRVRLHTAHTLLTNRAPRPGDLVLARIDRLRQHQRLENVHGRRVHLYPGDEIVVAYGDRYAADQFEALVPGDLGPTNLVAAGGIAATMVARHESVKPATRITPIGLIGDPAGRPVTLRDGALDLDTPSRALPPVIAVVGSSMNAGKTAMACGLVRGLSRAGLRVGAAKVTGTGSGGDLWRVGDAGAAQVLDFTDAGEASTYRLQGARLVRIARGLIGQLAAMDVVVVEIADGVVQRETAELLASRSFTDAVNAFLFAAGDPLAAVAGVGTLRTRGLPVAAVGGLLTRSPLAVREARGLGLPPVLGLSELSDPQHALTLLGRQTIPEVLAG